MLDLGRGVSLPLMSSSAGVPPEVPGLRKHAEFSKALVDWFRQSVIKTNANEHGSVVVLPNSS